MIKKKDAAAVKLGRKGGKASAGKLTAEQRKEKARNAAQAKWAKKKAPTTVNWLKPSTGFPRRQARRLTKREREVTEYAAQGRSNQYIADKLLISVNTVKKHISQALEKLGASNRTELAFLLTNDRSDREKRTSRLDNDLMGSAILEAAKEAYETAQYLLKRGRPYQRPRWIIPMNK
jgi:DNA-binding CsgD family transcriptional regulator